MNVICNLESNLNYKLQPREIWCKLQITEISFISLQLTKYNCNLRYVIRLIRSNISIKEWTETRKLSHCINDRAMRPIYGCREKFREALSSPTATFPEIFNGLLFRLILWMRVQNLKFVGGWLMGYEERERLIVRSVSFRDFKPMWSWSTNVTDRWTDGRADGQTDRLTDNMRGFCTIVHRAVKKCIDITIISNKQHITLR